MTFILCQECGTVSRCDHCAECKACNDVLAVRLDNDAIRNREIARLTAKIHDLEAQNAALKTLLDSRNLRARLSNKYLREEGGE